MPSEQPDRRPRPAPRRASSLPGHAVVGPWEDVDGIDPFEAFMSATDPDADRSGALRRSVRTLHRLMTRRGSYLR